MTELKEKYLKEVVPHMMKTFSYKNINQVPVIEKVVLNMGVGEAAANAKVLEHAINDMTKIKLLYAMMLCMNFYKDFSI